MFLTPDQINEVLAYWQPQLSLSDWQVRFERLPPHKMSSLSAAGTISWSGGLLLAWLKISDEERKEDNIQTDESIVVHELLHLRTSEWLDRTSDEMSEFEMDICVERPINVLSLLLVELRKESGHRWSWEEDTYVFSPTKWIKSQLQWCEGAD